MVAIYSTFLQRGYDQLVHDVALQNLPVLFALDRAGLVGADGATHAGTYDIRLPALHSQHERGQPRRMSANAASCCSTAFEQNHPVAVRYPRGAAAPRRGWPKPWGMGEMRCPSASGRGRAAKARASPSWPSARCSTRPCKPPKKLGATVVNMRWAKPLDTELLLKVAAGHDALVTVEEGAIMGGAGSAVSEALQADGVAKPVLHLGLKDEFIEHGDPAKLLAHARAWMPHGITAAVTSRFGALLESGKPAKPTLKSVA